MCKPVSVCPTGAYVSQNATTSSDALCSACDMACAQCTGPTRSDCQACNDKSFLFDTICNSTCPLGYFQSNSTRRCLPCAQPTCNLSQGLYLQVCVGSVDSFCANCSTCPGQTVAQPCSATADAICILISDSSRALAATAGISAGAAAGGVLLLLLLVILVVLFKRVSLVESGFTEEVLTCSQMCRCPWNDRCPPQALTSPTSDAARRKATLLR